MSTVPAETTSSLKLFHLLTTLQEKWTFWRPTWNFPLSASLNSLVFSMNCQYGRTNSMEWQTILWKSWTIWPNRSDFSSLPESATLTSPVSVHTLSPTTPATISWTWVAPFPTFLDPSHGAATKQTQNTPDVASPNFYSLVKMSELLYTMVLLIMPSPLFAPGAHMSTLCRDLRVVRDPHLKIPKLTWTLKIT